MGLQGFILAACSVAVTVGSLPPLKPHVRSPRLFTELHEFKLQFLYSRVAPLPHETRFSLSLSGLLVQSLLDI